MMLLLALSWIGAAVDGVCWDRLPSKTVLGIASNWLYAVSVKHFEDLFAVHVFAFAPVAQLGYGRL